MKWGMVIDLTKCTRCHGCVAACRIEHFLPLRVAWRKLIALETDDGGDGGCLHLSGALQPVQRGALRGSVPHGRHPAARRRHCLDRSRTNASDAGIASSPARTRTAPFYPRTRTRAISRAIRGPRSRRRAKSSIRTQVGHHHEVQFLHGEASTMGWPTDSSRASTGTPPRLASIPARPGR